MKTYKVIRHFLTYRKLETVKTGLSREEAQAHCNDSESSYETASRPDGKKRTEERGRWFDSYQEESKGVSS